MKKFEYTAEKPQKSKLSTQAVWVLLTILPIILISLLIFLSNFLIELEQSPGYAVRLYSGMLEYITMSLTLLTGGTFILDIAVKRG